jgi:hypothetical protein
MYPMTRRQRRVGYRAQETSTKARPDLWVKYVNRQIETSGELKTWNVALIAGELEPHALPKGLQLRARPRERDSSRAHDVDVYRIKRLVTTRDAAVDLTDDEWEFALSLDPRNKISGKDRLEPTAHALCSVRQFRELNPLLMIYLPKAKDIQTAQPVVGLAVSFPGSDRAIRDAVVYTVNTVFQAGRRGEEDDEIAELEVQ